ncbi:response regulator transcription factor [Eggerthellaceae bacterium zg-997]|nr:response regulator transcription factor [Eggerthellaceae bacterium zg-997]
MTDAPTAGFVQRWRTVFARVSVIPLVFFGVGLYRAWLSLFFRYDAFPSIQDADYFLFEAAIGVACLALALTARRVTPLWSNRLAGWAATAAMVGGSACIALACFVLPSATLKAAGLILAGSGLGALILMWAEFYGSLNPLRVALYHAIALFLGEALKWLFMGMAVSYLVFFSIALPLLLVPCVRASMHRLSERNAAQPTRQGDFTSVPLKPIALMAICTFAAAFGALPTQPLMVGNVAGALFVTALVFFGVLSGSRWFNFDTIYQLAFPLFIVGFMFVMPAIGSNPQIMALCYDAGYTMLSMYIMIVLSNITYRFGVNAVWLNGIERGIRYLVEMMGWAAFAHVSRTLSQHDADLIYTGVAIAVVLAFLFIFFTERGLSATWGMTPTSGSNVEHGPLSAERISLRVSDLSRTFGLSPREEEVLELLAERRSVSDIEQQLFVSQGTVKAHISHMYRKMGIHSRGELFDLIENPERPMRPLR